MEINSVINLIQDKPVTEQATDLTDKVAQNAMLDFDAVLSDAVEKEPELFQNACPIMPVSGNELPLAIDSNDDTFLDMLEKPEIEPELFSEIEDEKQPDLPFLMTQLLFDIPNQAIVLTEKPQLTMSNITMSSVTIPTVIASNEQADGAVLTSLESTMQEELSALPLDSEFTSDASEQEFKVLLNDSTYIQKQDRALQLLSNAVEKPNETVDVAFDKIAQPLQVDADSIEPKVVEFVKALNDSQSQESDVITSDKPTLLVNELYGSKDNVKTMVLPTAQQVNDEHFAGLFEQKLLDNVSVMVRRNENVAQIQIDPPELGKIDITIERSDDKTDIRFVAQVSETKQLIENTMDRLKLQFEQSGLLLGQVDVNSGHQGQQSMSRSFIAETQNIISQEDDVIAKQQSGKLTNNQLLDLYI